MKLSDYVTPPPKSNYTFHKHEREDFARCPVCDEILEFEVDNMEYLCSKRCIYGSAPVQIYSRRN